MKTRTLLLPVPFFALLVTCTNVAIAAPLAYITNGCEATVTLVNTANDAVITPPITVGNGPGGVVVNPTGTRVYVGNANDATVSVIDSTSNTVTAIINVGPEPFGIAINPAGTRVYVSNNGAGTNNTVSVIDTSLNIVIATITVGFGPAGVAVNPGGTRLYVVNNPESTLSVIDTSNNSVITTVSLNGSNAASGVVVNPSGTRVYVAGPDANLVHVLDTTTNTVITEVSVPGKVAGIALTPDGTKLYAALSFNADTVTVIDTASNSVVSTISVSGDVGSVAVTPDGTRAYVPSAPSNTVFVIDTTSNTVVDTLGVACAASFGPGFIGPQFLSFPLRGSGPYNTNISAVMDHDVKATTTGAPLFYTFNTRVAAYTGEEGILLCGHQPCSNPVGSTGLLGYKNTSDAPFLQVLNGLYTGGTCKTPPCSHFLFYTGHTGFDYPQTLGTEIIAPAPGLLFIPITSPSIFGEPVDKFNVLALDHGNGYASWFLHLGCNTETKNRACALNGGDFRGIDANGNIICATLRTTGCKVKRGDVIGLVGNKGVPAAHLHYEVRKGLTESPGALPVCGSGCLPVDPYGGTATDPYSKFLRGIANFTLWK